MARSCLLRVKTLETIFLLSLDLTSPTFKVYYILIYLGLGDLLRLLFSFMHLEGISFSRKFLGIKVLSY